MGNIDFNNKKILVTGGKGFLGSALCKVLKNHNADVYSIDNRNCEKPNEYCVDITDRDALFDVVNNIKPDTVFHLAALLNRGKELDDFKRIHQVNYLGTVNLLLAMENIKCNNFIFTSTSEIYGENKAPFTEDMQPDPTSSYSLSKVLAEDAVKYFCKLNKSNYTILRLFNFYGDGMPENFFIPQMLKQLQDADSFEMTDGEQARDFLHIDDVMEAMLLVAYHPNAVNQIFNVCSGKSLMLRDFVLECKKALNSNCEIKFGTIPYRNNEIWNMVGDNSKISSLLGFCPKNDIASFLHKKAIA